MGGRQVAQDQSIPAPSHRDREFCSRVTSRALPAAATLAARQPCDVAGGFDKQQLWQSKTVATAYLKSKQLLLFVFVLLL